MSDYQLRIITGSTMKSFKLRSLPNSLFINKTPTRDIFPNFVHFHFHFSLKNLPHENYFQTSFFTKKISHMKWYISKNWSLKLSLIIKKSPHGEFFPTWSSSTAAEEFVRQGQERRGLWPGGCAGRLSDICYVSLVNNTYMIYDLYVLGSRPFQIS